MQKSVKTIVKGKPDMSKDTYVLKRKFAYKHYSKLRGFFAKLWEKNVGKYFEKYQYCFGKNVQCSISYLYIMYKGTILFLKYLDSLKSWSNSNFNNKGKTTNYLFEFCNFHTLKFITVLKSFKSK